MRALIPVCLIAIILGLFAVGIDAVLDVSHLNPRRGIVCFVGVLIAVGLLVVYLTRSEKNEHPHPGSG